MATITTSRPATQDEMQAEIDRLHEAHAQMFDEAQRLRRHLMEVNTVAHSLASLLCGVAVVHEEGGFELIRRESVMELVTRWRMQWDAAMKQPNVKLGFRRDHANNCGNSR